jgi:hypothetical protein
MTFFYLIYIQIEYKSISEAQRMFESGYLSAIIDIGANFSRELVEQMNDW